MFFSGALCSTISFRPESLGLKVLRRDVYWLFFREVYARQLVRPFSNVPILRLGMYRLLLSTRFQAVSDWRSKKSVLDNLLATEGLGFPILGRGEFCCLGSFEALR